MNCNHCAPRLVLACSSLRRASDNNLARVIAKDHVLARTGLTGYDDSNASAYVLPGMETMSQQPATLDACCESWRARYEKKIFFFKKVLSLFQEGIHLSCFKRKVK